MDEIIIDGCNVAECEFFQSKYIVDNSIFCEFCTMFYNACLNNPDCYFKQLQRAKAELETTKQYADMLKANRCHHNVLSECSQEHHSSCVGKKQCILDLERIITDLKAENEKLKAENKELKQLKDMYFTFYKAKHDDINGTFFKFKQALEGIRGILENFCKGCTCECDCVIDDDECGYYTVKQKINEALNNERKNDK